MLSAQFSVITGRDPTLDDFGRVVLTLSVNGKDLGDLGVAARTEIND